jgi:hypothetical protein
VPESDDARKAQEERAKRLQEEIDNPPTGPPKSPREFIDQKMRELEKSKAKKRKAK